jgi:gluconate 2-dehydrogenase gamma chain
VSLTLFDDLQQQTLRAALDRIIPEDDFPGAWDAGCADYIAGQLTGQLAHLLPIYHAGLDGLEAEARAAFAAGFAGLTSERQDALLERIEAGDARANWETDAKAFFSMLVGHAAEGYYADPAQAGNRDRASWRMVGFNGR